MRLEKQWDDRRGNEKRRTKGPWRQLDSDQAIIERVEQVRCAPQVEQPHCRSPPGGAQPSQRKERENRGDEIAVRRGTGEGGDEIAVRRGTGEGGRQVRPNYPRHKECETNKAERVEREEWTKRLFPRKYPELGQR